MNLINKPKLSRASLFLAIGILSSIFSSGNCFAAAAKTNNWVVQIALEEKVNPRLVYAVIGQESSFRPQAVSYKGAIGLMQLMPETARRFGVNPYNPQENVRGGCRYLRYLGALFGGRVELVLAGYNAGEGAVIKYKYQIPPYAETRDYVWRILNSPYLRQPSAAFDSQPSPTFSGVSNEPSAKPSPPQVPPATQSGFLFH